MFGNENKSTGSSTAVSATSASINSIVQNTQITGNIETGSDLRIDGRLKGDINCSGKLIIASNGVVEGDVSCNNAVIEGKFTGTIVVHGTLTLRDSAAVNGKITTAKLVVQSGAVCHAACTMTK